MNSGKSVSLSAEYSGVVAYVVWASTDIHSATVVSQNHTLRTTKEDLRDLDGLYRLDTIQSLAQLFRSPKSDCKSLQPWIRP